MITSTEVLRAPHQNWLSWLQNFQGLLLYPPHTTPSKGTLYFPPISHWQLNIKLWLFLSPQANTQKKKYEVTLSKNFKEKHKGLLGDHFKSVRRDFSLYCFTAEGISFDLLEKCYYC